MSSGFFSIDRRTWATVCDLGEINFPATYLSLACGSGSDNRNTRWSATALTTHLGIRWVRGKDIIKRLREANVIRYGEKHTEARPRYELLSYPEIRKAQMERTLSGLSSYQRDTLLMIQQGKSVVGRRDGTAKELQNKGLLKSSYPYEAVPDPPQDVSTDDLIWLPKTIVEGTSKGEESPVKRLRMDGDIWALRLLVDLYYEHNLRDDGGISPLVLYGKYKRESVGQQGHYNVWAFQYEGSYLIKSATPFQPHLVRGKKADGKTLVVWDTLHKLEDHGLLYFVPHLWESDALGQSEPILPYGTGNGAEPLETEIGTAAHVAGYFMASPTKLREIGAGWHLAPVKGQKPNVQMISIARLRYRPHTKRSKAWYGNLQSEGPGLIRQFSQLSDAAQKTASEATA